MSPVSVDIDLQLIENFLDESIDSLDDISAKIVLLESNPDNIELINQLMRPVHSIKGSAPFFGFTKVRILAHELESLLVLLRNKERLPSAQATTILLEGIDALQHMLARCRNGESEISDAVSFLSLVERVKDEISNKSDTPETVWKHIGEALNKFQNTLSQEVINSSDYKTLLELLARVRPEIKLSHNNTPTLPNSLQKIFTILQEPFQNVLIEEDSQKVLNCLQELLTLSKDTQATKAIEETLETCAAFSQSVGFDPLLRQIVLDKLGLFRHSKYWVNDHSPQEIEANISSVAIFDNTELERHISIQDVSEAEAKTQIHNLEHNYAQRSMRVSQKHIDNFLSYVGELIVVGEMFTYFEKQLEKSSIDVDLVTELKRANVAFGKLSHDLQTSIMSVRRVPAKGLLQKAPKMVRDIAEKKGKEIEVTVIGENLEVDKSHLELLDAPLTHLVRNAADHGIELPAKRELSKKPKKGHITVCLEEFDKWIILSVQDDGGGLNYEAIQKKAESLGLVQAGRAISERNIIDLIFAPGLSTAEAVTDISGRGVGMDVVKRSIEDANGNIEVSSTTNEGTTFKITLPKNVTTQIIDGFVLALQNNIYVVPLEKVIDSYAVKSNEIKNVMGGGKCVTRHETIMPVHSLANLLKLHSPTTSKLTSHKDSATLITIMHNKTPVALIVDELLGVQQVVVKKINSYIKSDSIVGGAVMGDGKLALVLDLEKLLTQQP